MWWWSLCVVSVLGSWMNTIEIEDIHGNIKTLDSYHKGKKALLIVNVASECGYTEVNYHELQDLYNDLQEAGLEILAFPCNQFGGQEPSSNANILSFVQDEYDITFPMAAKINVNGPDAHPLFQYLKEALPGTITNDIKWNFTKFLIVQGKPTKRYGFNEDPSDFQDEIESYLNTHQEL